MIRALSLSAPSIVLLATLTMPAASAQSYEAPARLPQPLPAMPVAQSQYPTQPPLPMSAQMVEGAAPVMYGTYPHLNAPMYSSPSPHVPIWTHPTMIPTQALAPHEMLYPHTYRAMYPPFYHRVKGKYLWTPFGVRTHENWELQGTMVEVKYRSQAPMFSGWHRPVISTNKGPWY